MTKRLATTLLLLLAAAACNPAGDKPAASVSDPASPEAVDNAAADTERKPGALMFTGSNSKITLVGAKVTESHDVLVKDFRGDIQLADGAPLESGQVEVVMQLGSIESDSPKLTKHLKSPDFFEVDKHPTATFKSTGVTAGGADGASHTVKGQLTLRGTTKAIAFPATITRSGEGVNVKAEFTINRKDFGIVYPGMPDNLIRDDVVIKLDLKAS